MNSRQRQSIRPEESIERALSFLERHLKSPVSLDEIAHEACYSKFHFIRLFRAVTGETVMEYLRKRRLSEAGLALVKTDTSILDIALEYQFESQEAFTRSFQQVFGMPPGHFRKKGSRHLSFDRFTLSKEHLEILANFKPMEPKIVEIAPKLLVGQHSPTALANNQIPALWQGFMPRRMEIQNRIGEAFYAVHHYEEGMNIENFTISTIYESWACVEVSSAENIPNRMKSRILEGGLYAIFIYRGPATKFASTFNYIHREWLPQSEYELDERDHFEVMGPKYLGPAHPDSEEEVWVPIRKK